MNKQDEVRLNAVDYFKDELTANVWFDKYCLKDIKNNKIIDVTPEHTIIRVACEIHRIEKSYPNPTSYTEIYELMSKYKRFVLGGSPLFGIGNNTTLSTLGNCFVIDSPVDSYGGVFKTDQELAQLMKRRGGVGVDISTLRSKGSLVNNAASSSTGAVSFMNRFSNTTREVAQEGRRGALMLTMDIDHDDVNDFIESKDDLTKITGANISVKVSDIFMESLKTGNEKNIRTWNKIIHQAWKNAEPGVLFWDKIIRESPADCYKDFKTIATNPCVSENTLILTDNGYKKISDYVNKKVNVWNGTEFSNVIPQITGKTNQWYNITFSDGSELKCTPYHKFYLKNYNTETLASQLTIGDKLQKFMFPIINDNSNKISKDLYTYGFFCGDGTIKRGEATIDLYGDKKLLLDLLTYRRYRKEKDGVSWKLYLGTKWDKKFVPDTTFSLISKLTYLAGLLDSDGSLNSIDGSLNISSIDRDFLLNIKYLLNTIGATGTISLMKKSCSKLMPNGHGSNSFYECKTSYRIVINATNVKKLINLGLKTHRVKLIANPNRDASRFITITNIELLNVDNEDTYCFNEPLKHRGVFNGILTGQCGELPLCAYDSCRLSAINIYEYVNNPFTKDASFNWEQLAHDTRIAQRIMDNIVDLESERIIAILHKIFSDPEDTEIKAVELDLWDKVYQKLMTGRRTGLGQMGLADAGAALGLRYGSPEFILWASKVSHAIATNSYISSITMAEERGSFTAYDRSLELDNPFIQRILSNIEPEYVDKYFKFGRRNIANLTIAPTGSISMLAGVTSGIEPVFALSYNRKRKVTDDNPNKKIQDKQGDWWEEYEVFHPKFKKWIGIQSKSSVFENEMSDSDLKAWKNESPYYKATAHEIDPYGKIKLQSEIQRWIDHSISVTYNLPKTISEAEVSKLYFEAWEKGLKGFTIYRDGSREGILTTNKPQEFQQHDAPKRPKILPHDVYSIMSKGHHWMVSVGMLEGKPYEVFAFNNVEIIGSKFVGEMTKLAKGRYDLHIPSESRTFQNITNGCSDEENLLTRMISTSLRHGANIKFIVEQLNKSTGDITSFGKAIGRILNKYVPDSAKKTNICPECGAIMAYEGGCLICKDCGYSKCG